MSKPLPTPSGAAELTQVLSQRIEAELETPGHTSGETVLIRIQFEGGLPELSWLEAVSVVTSLFSSRDVSLNFTLYHEHQDGFKKAVIHLLIP